MELECAKQVRSGLGGRRTVRDAADSTLRAQPEKRPRPRGEEETGEVSKRARSEGDGGASDARNGAEGAGSQKGSQTEESRLFGDFGSGAASGAGGFASFATGLTGAWATGGGFGSSEGVQQAQAFSSSSVFGSTPALAPTSAAPEAGAGEGADGVVERSHGDGSQHATEATEEAAEVGESEGAGDAAVEPTIPVGEENEATLVQVRAQGGVSDAHAHAQPHANLTPRAGAICSCCVRRSIGILGSGSLS